MIAKGFHLGQAGFDANALRGLVNRTLSLVAPLPRKIRGNIGKLSENMEQSYP